MLSLARNVALPIIFLVLASMSCSTSIRLLPPAGVTELRARAQAGVPGAQFNLGVMYAEGRGVPQDEAAAVYWYRLAAEQGLAEAQLNLGDMYAEGRGVSQDEAEAARWYRLAAAQGYPREP
ncbi:MAG: tetratricopeptide repeat protein [Acidobacteriota bacterium]|nr:tetratricopeptide repeat protein [Acidobacteriota bacterium]